MKVSEVMKKEVITVPSDMPFPQIVKLLVENEISGAPIVNKKGKVVGVISEKDLFKKLFPSQKEFYKNMDFYMNYNNLEKESKRVLEYKANRLMSRNVVTVRPDDTIMKACSLFIIHNIRRLPVIDKGKLVGIVTTNKIYKNFLMSLI